MAVSGIRVSADVPDNRGGAGLAEGGMVVGGLEAGLALNCGCVFSGVHAGFSGERAAQDLIDILGGMEHDLQPCPCVRGAEGKGFVNKFKEPGDQGEVTFGDMGQNRNGASWCKAAFMAEAQFRMRAPPAHASSGDRQDSEAGRVRESRTGGP